LTENWLDQKLGECVEQISEDADLSFELDAAIWLHEIIKENKIVITKEMWREHRLEIGDEFVDDE
tara:strand:+ start:118 stop:312 length:195 start_codon:yes stop_codon:yes gene_type:complete